MKTWFVTRHPGAIKWAASKGIKVSNRGIVDNIDVEKVEAGDRVVGTLPVNLAADVIEKGAEYYHLSLEVPRGARGKDLSPEEMESFGAKIERYEIRREHAPQTVGNSSLDKIVMVAIASEQTLPTIIPLLSEHDSPVAKLHLIVTGAPFSDAVESRIRRVAELVNLPVVRHESPAEPFGNVLEAARRIIGIARSDDPGAMIVLNATGGTKIISTAYANALGPAGRVIYCDTRSGRIESLYSDGAGPKQIAPELLNLRTFLLAQGHEIVNDNSKDAVWMTRVRQRQELTYALAAGLNLSAFRRNIGSINYAAENAIKEDREGNVIEYHPVQSFKGTLCRKMRTLLQDNGIITDYQPCTPKDGMSTISFPKIGNDENIELVRYIKGLWLEEYCALEMSSLEFDPGHWGCGVKIRPVNAQIGDGSLNELDLAIVWRNRLLVYECKSGTISKDSQNILNKLQAIKNYVAGSLGETWLLCASGYGRGDAAASARARVEAYRIPVIAEDEVLNLKGDIQRWLGDYPPTSPRFQ